MGRRLYVGNLPYQTTDEDLNTLFSQAGAVETVRVMRDMATGRARGFAFVEMATDDAAQQAIAKFHDHQMEGRALVVNEARPKPEGSRFGGGDCVTAADARGGGTAAAAAPRTALVAMRRSCGRHGRLGAPRGSALAASLRIRNRLPSRTPNSESQSDFRFRTSNSTRSPWSGLERRATTTRSGRASSTPRISPRRRCCPTTRRGSRPSRSTTRSTGCRPRRWSPRGPLRRRTPSG